MAWTQSAPDEGFNICGDRPLTRHDAHCVRIVPPSPTRGEGIFLITVFLILFQGVAITRKCGSYVRLHIGSKIEAIESSPDADIETNQAETVGSSRRGSDIDLFGYSKSIINLDAKVAHRALDLGVAKQELYGS